VGAAVPDAGPAHGRRDAPGRSPWWADAPREGLRLVLVSKTPAGRWRARPEAPPGTPALELLARHGQVPLPPYIRRAGPARPTANATRPSTPPSRAPSPPRRPGCISPPDLLATLAERGVERAFVTLHVGPGTFQPVQAEDVRQHRVEPEWGELPAATAGAIAATRARGGHVVAVGTTTVRVLESAARAAGPGEPVGAWSGSTDLTVCPPFEFRVVDALVTNFHLPRSSLLLLVAAFVGRERLLDAYQLAVEQGYRFYSYGDAMLIA